MFNRQFSNKNQTNIYLTIPISSATQKGKNAFNGSPWQQLCFITSTLPTGTGVTLNTHSINWQNLQKNRFVSRTPHFLKFEKDLVPLSIAAHTVHAMMLIHVCRLTTDIMSQRNSICALALAYVSTHHLILGITEQDVITSIMNAYTTLPVESTFVTLYSGN